MIRNKKDINQTFLQLVNNCKELLDNEQYRFRLNINHYDKMSDGQNKVRTFEKLQHRQQLINHFDMLLNSIEGIEDIIVCLFWALEVGKKEALKQGKSELKILIDLKDRKAYLL